MCNHTHEGVLETQVAFTVATLGFLQWNLQHLTCVGMRGYVEILQTSATT